MEAATSTITAERLAEITEKTKEPDAVIKWGGFNLVIRRTISLTETLAFVEGVIKNCFDDTTGSYRPEYKEFLVNNFMVQLYTNVELPEDSEERHRLIYESGIMRLIRSNIDMGQHGEILRAIDDKLEHRVNSDITAVNRQMAELYAAMNQMQGQLNELFSGISPQDFSALLSSLSNGALDEEKLVNAYLAQAVPA